MINKIQTVIANRNGSMHILFICFLAILAIIVYLFINKVSPETAWQLKNGIYMFGKK